MFRKILQSHWEKPKLYLSIILHPLSIIFYILVSLRIFLYYIKIIPTKKIKVPVIAIGNIHIGGTGKTPIVISIANNLIKKGIKVGIISRGYGRKTKEILLIDQKSCCLNNSVNKYGDEPLLISYKTNAPVAVGNDKFKTANFLLEKHRDIQIIISDDGLQHYKLFKDYEIVVFPAQEINKQMPLLPQYKLREPLKRLEKSNAIIFTTNNNKNVNLKKMNLNNISLHNSYIIYDNIYCLNDINKKIEIDYFKNKKNIAICAIANPNRFFNSLKELGIKLEKTLIFNDHHIFNKNNIPNNFDNIFITEKDAVKIKQFNLNNIWVLPVKIIIEPDIIKNILKLLNKYE